MEILVRRPLEVPREEFRVQHEYRLEVAPRAINGLISLCETNGLGAVICHSHPAKSPYSASDDFGERRIVEALRPFIPRGAPTASLLFWPGGVTGRIWLPGKEDPEEFSEVTVVGHRIQRLQRSSSSGAHVDLGIYDRQVRAFGEEGQAALGKTKVAIVGLGGTGSPTAEQLARLGVIDFVLIDPDRFDPSNVTRMYGTYCRRSFGSLFRGPLKVKLVARHLRRINSAIRLRTIPLNVVHPDAVALLLDRDVVFLCTDDHWGRAMVNQVAYQYLVPTINLGMRIDAPKHRLTGARGVVDLLQPDTPCLWCKGSIRANRIAAESMPDDQRQALEREGYAEGVGTQAPSVISVTTTLAGLGASVFLQLVTGFMGEGGRFSRLNYDILEGTVSRGKTPTLEGCICRRVRGRGHLEPLPTVNVQPYEIPCSA